MYFGILIAFIPLLLGYLIRLKEKKNILLVNKTLNLTVYVILFLMGTELSQLDNLLTHFKTIALYTSILFLCTYGCNFIALALLDTFLPWQRKIDAQPNESRLKMLLESLRICLALVAGFICGFIPIPIWEYNILLSKIILFFLLLLVGIQLRSNHISVKQILLNKIGIITTIIVIVSAIFGGWIMAIIFDLPSQVGMAMASGFGWYSLSGILMTEAHGPIIGSITFLNDILRELISIILIPSLIQRFRLTTLGLCGATSMDFTLPMLQKGAGISIVPSAIVQGFLLTIIMPILITFFNYIPI